MERLPYSDQKTSNKTKTVLGVDWSDPNRIAELAKDVVIGIIMGIGSFMVLISTFGLEWYARLWNTGSLGGGMVYSWNTAARNMAARDGVFLQQLAGQDDANGLFLTAILFILMGAGVAISLSRNKWMTIFYVLLLGLPSVIWGMHASVLGVTVLAAGVLLFFINSDIRNIKQAYRGFIYAVVMAAAAFAILCIPAVSGLADRPQAVDDYRTGVQDSAVTSYYGENPLHDGDLTVKKRKTGKGTALKVTMTSPDSLYLRGFVGDELDRDGWKPLTYSTYYEDQNLFFWLRQNGFNTLGQISQSAQLAEQGGQKSLNMAYSEQTNQVTVKNVNASTKYAYVPYEISIDGVKDTKSWGDNFLTGGKLHKVEEYSFTTSPNKVGHWTDIAAQFYTNKFVPYEQTTYLDNESYYNAYVYKKYTYMSDDDRNILAAALGDKGDQQRGHVDYNEAVTRIKSLLAGSFYYSEVLDSYSTKYTALQNIFSSRTGYDSHYATAAVMMFRYYGIPARYVEGYMITQTDASVGGGTINVSRNNAHAWPEIYVDGIGWVPVEVCPVYSGLMAEADYTKGITSQQKNPLIDKSKINSEDPNIVVDNNKSNAGSKKLPNKALLVLAALAALALLALIVWLVIRLIRHIKASIARNKLFKEGDIRDAIRGIYGYMDSFGVPMDEETVNTGNKASYSESVMFEKERQLMLGKLKTLKKAKRKKDRENFKSKFKSSKGDKKAKSAKKAKSPKAAKPQRDPSEKKQKLKLNLKDLKKKKS